MTSQDTLYDTTTPLTRWYMDRRNPELHQPALPLLDTLQPTDQEAVQRFYHLKDRQMSLASNLLKYLFVHRTCHIPWSSITISRTPAPHKRPCYIPNPPNQDIPKLEFNVSHQASLVALAGTTSPPLASSASSTSSSPGQSSSPPPQVGIDITCVNERRSTAHPDTLITLNDYVDIFAEVFSTRELQTIKSTAAQRGDVAYGFRLFYAYWALKEAYIKMTGEALLAPWLRELEFTDVIPPEPGATEPYTGVKTWLRGEIVRDVRVEIVAFEEDYLIATAARGGEVGKGSGEGAWGTLRRVVIKDIEPCARGRCGCVASG